LCASNRDTAESKSIWPPIRPRFKIPTHDITNTTQLYWRCCGNQEVVAGSLAAEAQIVATSDLTDRTTSAARTSTALQAGRCRSLAVATSDNTRSEMARVCVNYLTNGLALAEKVTRRADVTGGGPKGCTRAAQGDKTAVAGHHQLSTFHLKHQRVEAISQVAVNGELHRLNAMLTQPKSCMQQRRR
jgi:hypothetical protein